MHPADAGQEDIVNTYLKRLASRWIVIAAASLLAVIVAVGTVLIFAPSGPVAPVIAAEKRTGVPAKAGQRRILYYRNAMGLPDTSPVPKKDSMGMDYVPVYADEVPATPGSFRLTTEKIQRAGVRTAMVTRMRLVNSVRATGTVAADESKQAILNARFDGFVEKLFVSTTGAEVRAGQTLMQVWIQSPEVLIREADFVGSLDSKQPAHAAQAAALLREYGIPPSAIAEMRRTRQPLRSIPIAAPIGGTVLDKPVVEGMHFTAGDTLFKTADLSTVWVLAQVSERDLAQLREGLMAKVTFPDDPGASFDGRVAFIYPDISPDTRTALVRLVVQNAGGRIRIGQYADVEIDVPVAAQPVLAVPDSAVIDSGSRQVAFLAKPDGVFEPRTLTLGARAGGYDEVRSGLSEGDRIVVSGNFLIDAESDLKTALGTFSKADGAQ